jgi:Putative bacterial sensory transduction regulator
VAATDVVDRYISALPGETRRLGHAEWGISIAPEQAGGWPLDVGLRISEGLLRIQAYAVPADPLIDLGQLLHWNRGTRIARFACTASGDVWVQADVPVTGLDEGGVDRALGLVAEGALAVRSYLSALKAPADDPAGSGWLPG